MVHSPFITNNFYVKGFTAIFSQYLIEFVICLTRSYWPLLLPHWICKNAKRLTFKNINYMTETFRRLCDLVPFSGKHHIQWVPKVMTSDFINEITSKSIVDVVLIEIWSKMPTFTHLHHWNSWFGLITEDNVCNGFFKTWHECSLHKALEKLLQKS